MSQQKYYYKATLDNGQSQNPPTIYYRKGIIVHPNPERRYKDDCGQGIHLAKTLTAAITYVPKATEFYLAEAGVILGEGTDKIRCASCRIIKRLQKRTIERILQQEEAKRL